ncbi:hypothetical protein HMPREF3039_01161 [Akkermansia sp. KLE1798]|nr:hypothetical protein HMPREF3039_01161 [Akkermansia sp. KLE1798]KZA06032.1 hypothetical protein HMPREF1326_00296 [Akkermansia sp. KLE1605]
MKTSKARENRQGNPSGEEKCCGLCGKGTVRAPESGNMRIRVEIPKKRTNDTIL